MLADTLNATTGWVEVLLLVTALFAAVAIIFLQGGHRVLTRPRRRGNGGGPDSRITAADAEDFNRLLRL